MRFKSLMYSECLCVVGNLFENIFMCIYVKILREIIQIPDLAVIAVSLSTTRCFPTFFLRTNS